MKEFLTSQTALILTLVSGGLGYFIRYFFESKSKRQYRKFEMFEELKIKAITGFIENYFISFDFINDILNYEQQKKIELNKKLQHSYYIAISYCTEKEQVLFSEIIQKVNTLFFAADRFKEQLDKKELKDSAKDADKIVKMVRESRAAINKLIAKNLIYYK
jgi:hypothetical protein